MGKKTKEQRNKHKRLVKKAQTQFAFKMAKLPPPEIVLSWIAQGANYLASDYDTGLWDPIFENLYEGQTLTVQQMADRIMTKHKSALEHPTEWSDGKLLLAWVIADPSLLLTYRKGALKKLQQKFSAEESETLLLAPRQPDLWELFHTVKATLKEKYS